VGKDVERTQM